MTLNIAHRGAGSLAPENTLAAAEVAFQVGADGWEMDVTASADGELVLLHDDTLLRTSNVSQVFPERAEAHITTFTMDELRSLDVGSWFVETDPFEQIVQGTIPQDKLDSYRELQIPTLQEALAYNPRQDWHAFIEIKVLPEHNATFPIVQKVLDLVSDLDMLDRVIISSFNHQYLHQAKDLNPHVRTTALLAEDQLDMLDVPVRFFDGYNPKQIEATDEKVRELLDAGFLVTPAIVNEEEDMKRFLGLGVTAILTDFPQRLHRAQSKTG